jgi:hypothetical protein
LAMETAESNRARITSRIEEDLRVRVGLRDNCPVLKE